MLVWELTLYNAASNMRNIILSLFSKPQIHVKMPKAHRKSGGDEEDDVPLHGTTNKEEAKNYSNGLDDIIIQMGANVKEELFDAMKDAIVKYKEAIASMFPNMETANPDAVWRVVKDKVGLCICPQSQESEKTLQCMVPDEEVPQAVEVLGKIEEVM